ncbi:MAG: NosD domain-containing protein, partial [Candidatus Thorarchaeota archaeon]
MAIKKNKKLAILILTFFSCSILAYTFSFNNHLSNMSTFDKESLKTSATLTDFQINDISTNNWTWAKNMGYATGFGTSGSPFVIEDQIFEYSIGIGNCLEIINSRKYFILRNCTFRNADMSSYGLYLNNVTNGLIVDCSVSVNAWPGDTGIYMNDVNDTEIRDSDVIGNTDHGIFHTNSHYNTFSGNNISANTAMGIYGVTSTHNTISNNHFYDNGIIGILLVTGSDSNTISDNFFT